MTKSSSLMRMTKMKKRLTTRSRKIPMNSTTMSRNRKRNRVIKALKRMRRCPHQKKLGLSP